MVGDAIRLEQGGQVNVDLASQILERDGNGVTSKGENES